VIDILLGRRQRERGMGKTTTSLSIVVQHGFSILLKRGGMHIILTTLLNIVILGQLGSSMIFQEKLIKYQELLMATLPLLMKMATLKILALLEQM
jgi:hypothetical protein